MFRRVVLQTDGYAACSSQVAREGPDAGYSIDSYFADSQQVRCHCQLLLTLVPNMHDYVSVKQILDRMELIFLVFYTYWGTIACLIAIDFPTVKDMLCESQTL